MRRRTLLAAGSAGAAALAGCSSRRVATRADTGQATPDPRLGTVETFLPAQRKSAPKVAGELLDGHRVDIAGWLGSVVVINFWGSWCGPCRAEAPDLQANYLATMALSVRFLGVDIRDGRDTATAFQSDFGITYPSLFDPPGQIALGVHDVPPDVVPADVVPATVLLDRQMRIAAALRKRVAARELEAAVRALGAEGRA